MNIPNKSLKRHSIRIKRNKPPGAMERFTGYVIKIIIAAGLVYWLMRSNRLSLTAIEEITLNFKTVSLIMAGIVGVFVGQALLALRLKLLLIEFDVHILFSKMYGLTLISSFVGIVLPGLVGGDTVKAICLFDDKPEERNHILAAVVVDRLTGLYSIFLLATLTLLGAKFTNELSYHTPILSIAPVIVLVTAGGFVLGTQEGLYRRRIIRVMWGRCPTKIHVFFQAFQNYLRNPKLLAASVCLSLLNYVFLMLAFIIASELLEETLPVASQLSVIPLSMAMSLIPLTPGGVGFMEGAFSFFYTMLGSPNGAAIGLLGRLIQYIAVMVGGSIGLLTR